MPSATLAPSEAFGPAVLRAAAPCACLLGSPAHSVLFTAAGTGASLARGQALTRWHAERLEDADGVFVYVCDAETGRFWSAGHAPTEAAPDRYGVRFGQGVAEIAREDDGVETCLGVAVTPGSGGEGGPAEVRRVRLTNRSGRPRQIEVTGYAEPVLQAAAADLAHPAFSKLFVETERLPGRSALVARRRPRSPEEAPAFGLLALCGPPEAEDAWETSRAAFIGRGRTLAAPAALASGEPLAGTLGAVLDPALALRRTLTLAPGASADVTFVLAAPAGREAALALAEAVEAAGWADRAFEAAARADGALREALGPAAEEAARADRLAGAFFYGAPELRAPARLLAQNARPPADLARLGISGRAPLIVVCVRDREGLGPLRALARVRACWRARGWETSLLALCEGPALQAEASALRREASGPVAEGSTSPAQAFALDARALDPSLVALAQAAAHLYADGSVPEPAAEGGEPPPALFRPLAASETVWGNQPTPPLGEVAPPPAGSEGVQAERSPQAIRSRHVSNLPVQSATDQADLVSDSSAAQAPASENGEAEALREANGWGGFSPDGAEYVVRLPLWPGGRHRLPPLPWSNVVANAEGGFIASERGAGPTWSVNSREHRLTPWFNDPVRDPHGEAVYLRDLDAGTFWSAAPGPAPAPVPYEVRHGWGYTAYRHHAAGLDVDLTEWVPREGAVRLSRLRVTNTGTVPRRVEAVRYARLVLGALTAGSERFVVTEWDAEAGALVARNPAGAEFADRVAFVAAVASPPAPVHFTASRDAFVGPGGSPACPLALATARTFGGEAGAGLDPCAALALALDVGPGETAEVTFLLGDAPGREAARALVARLGTPDAVAEALEGVQAFWRGLAGTVQIETPEPALDLMGNGWLVYQNLACRMWGRSAYYQSGGAYGFRDQLQDAAAFALTAPEITRAQIVRHAGQQFAEGDVLHWWHPPLGKGIRTRFADDLLWLPYVAAGYVRQTGDASVLDEPAPWLRARALGPGEDEAFVYPEATGEAAGVYAHAVAAMDRSLGVGAHGLPFIGTGDWNDGMNRVGREGRGESVWMGFFLFEILGEWAPLCAARGDHARAARYAAHRERLGEALNRDGAGWDGAWYRRAYYDDGTPLGSAQSDEARIDALAQAWAVLSGTAPPDKAALALDAMEAYLVDEGAGLIRLLAPPFDRTPHDPGYIKGYLPGVRENGGQYTHAALWAVRALARAGRAERAAPLLAMLSPVSHTRTPDAAARYQAEPYVVAADVYGVAPHVGRGGWTWYTGSAGWMQRVLVESVLGFDVEGGAWLTLAPCIPRVWPGFSLRYTVPGGEGTAYAFTVTRGLEASATLDGEAVALEGGTLDGGVLRLPLLRDGRAHAVRLTLSTP